MTDEIGGKLTNKQRVFVDEYLRDFNATQAAIRAGYSERTAYSIGSRLLSFVEVEAEINRRLDERSMKPSEIIDRLTSHGRGDMGDFLDIEGVAYSLNLEKAKELGLTHLIKKIKERTVMTSGKDGDTETHFLEVELYDAHAALVDLGKIRGLFVDKTDITTKGESLNKRDEERDERANRALLTLAEAIGKIVPGQGND